MNITVLDRGNMLINNHIIDNDSGFKTGECVECLGEGKVLCVDCFGKGCEYCQNNGTITCLACDGRGVGIIPTRR